MLGLDLVGVGLASVAALLLRDVAAKVRGPRLARAWRGLILLVLCCIGLLVAAAASDAGKSLDLGDLAGATIHALGSLFALAVALLSRRTARDVLRVASLEEAAFVDSLTGLANRRRFDERLAEEVRRARDSGRPLALVALDLDHFKAINDAHGHGVGDLVLKRVAVLIAARAAGGDTACRIGGEEFALIVPGLEQGFVIAAAERLRRAVAEVAVALEDGRELRATVSLGLAALRSGESAEGLARRADAALYAAKRAGRDRLSLAA